MAGPALLDVNVLVALAWDSHVHHRESTRWFAEHRSSGSAWATCPVTESGFVRVSSNPAVLPAAISASDAIGVLRAMRAAGSHRFLADDVSMLDPDLVLPTGHRQVTDVHLLALAKRHAGQLITFDRALAELADDGGVQLLKST